MESKMQTNKSLKIDAGNIHQVEATLTENGISGKILYVSDPVVDKLYGDIVKPQIEAVGRIKTETVDYNTIAYAMSVAERVIATDVNCIVALGGGKVLDVCKYAAYISKCPLLSIPTTMANDGIASPIAVLKRQDNKPKSLGCAMPTMLLLDTELIMNSPKQLIKAGIGDTISNYMALIDWKHACRLGKDKLNGYAYMMSQTSLDALMKTQYDVICPEFISVLANSLVLSGIAMDYAGSSRPVSGSEHLFSHALDYYSAKPNLHGIQVALGTVAVLKLVGKDYSSVMNYLNKFNVEINPAALGIDMDTFVVCMQNATSMRQNRYTYLSEADLSTDRVKTIYKQLVEEL
jgi:glycerol-1-phosphate dehydrogenase [NAD(P)+]